MQKRALPIVVTVLLAVATLTVVACAPKTPEERISQARGRYTARLNAFIVQETPVEPEPVAAEGEGGEAPAEPVAVTDEAGEEGEAMEEAPVETRTDVELDLLVQHDLDTALPGITLDVTMASPDGTEKASWKIYVETAGLPKANQKQVSYILEDVDYQEGDGFAAEIRHPVPPEERGEYREFAAAGG
ncbi:MAG: hypothetical protein R3325_13870 [Thermoanaerobaculia bacterium]|nr:hypothetical protein [Thermoanaerobaculia bacterium]